MHGQQMNVTALVYHRRYTLPLQIITAHGYQGDGRNRYRTLQHIGIRTTARMVTTPKYNPIWTPSQMDTIPNGCHHEWTQSRMDTIPNGYHPEWTLSRMDIIPNGHHHKWTRF